MTTLDVIRLVAAREVRVKLRDRTFLFSTVFFLLIAVVSTVLPAVLSSQASTVATADGTAAALLRAKHLTVRVVADDAAAERLVRDGDADAAVVSGPQILAMDTEPGDVVGALSVAPPVRLLDPDAVDPFLAFVVPFALAMAFFLTAFTFGLQIAQSVTEEKQTRVVEILVSSVPPRALLTGKVAALTGLAFAQIALTSLLALGGLKLAGTDPGVLRQVAPALGWFVPFFVLGFLMLAALWAGVGALAARQEDIGSLSMPLQLAIMLPFFAVIFLRDNATAMTVLSYVPLSAPMAMPARLFQGHAAGWEPVLALVVLAATTVGLVLAGGRLYEGSLLRTNGRTSVRTAWRDRSTVA